MTMNSKPASSTPIASTVQDHHLKASEHLGHAAQCHKDAAKSVGAGEHKTASTQVKEAGEHLAQAVKHIEHAEHASKKTAEKATHTT